MAEGVVAARCMAGSPQMFTDWDGLMDDLFHNKGKLAFTFLIPVFTY